MTQDRRSPLARARTLGVLLIAALAAFSGACQTTLQGATPAQRFFEAQTVYASVLDAAVTYAESPGADPDVVRTLAAANHQAQALITQGRILLRAPEGPERDVGLDQTARLLIQLTGVLRQYLAERAGGDA